LRIVSVRALVAARDTLAFFVLAVAGASSGRRSTDRRLLAASAARRARPASAAAAGSPAVRAARDLPLAPPLRPAAPRAVRSAAFDPREAAAFSVAVRAPFVLEAAALELAELGPKPTGLEPADLEPADFAADVSAAEVLARELAARALLASTLLARELLDAAVRAVLAAAVLTVRFVAPASFSVFILFVFVALFVFLLDPLADALAARDLVDLASPSLTPPRALDGALRLLAVFLLEGIRGYSLSLPRCGDGTGSHMTEEARPPPARIAPTTAHSLGWRKPDASHFRTDATERCRRRSVLDGDGEPRVSPTGKTRPLRQTRPNAIR
jgi:hypothetical protein